MFLLVLKCVAGHWHKNAIKGWKLSTKEYNSLLVRSSTQELRSSVRPEIERNALERTRNDLSAHEKTLVFFIIYSFLFSCNPTLGGAVESRNTTFVVLRPLCFLIVSVCFSWFQLILTCLLWSWGAKPSTKVEDEAS